MKGRFAEAIRRALADPAAVGIEPDAPEAPEAHRRMILAKPLLRRVYQTWYALIRERLPAGEGATLEIGSGAGFAAACIPGIVTSDVMKLPWNDRVIDALALPFRDGELRAIAMVNAFHHIPDPARFLHEASRAVRPGGRIVMVEPWRTGWSRLVYRNLHHEPWDEAGSWRLAEGHPMRSANGALPWIVFRRDAERLRREFPEWSPRGTTPIMPLSYLLSGGVSMRALAPGWSASALRTFEKSLGLDRLGMFAVITLERQDIAR